LFERAKRHVTVRACAVWCARIHVCVHACVCVGPCVCVYETVCACAVWCARVQMCVCVCVYTCVCVRNGLRHSFQGKCNSCFLIVLWKCTTRELVSVSAAASFDRHAFVCVCVCVCVYVMFVLLCDVFLLQLCALVHACVHVRVRLCVFTFVAAVSLYGKVCVRVVCSVALRITWRFVIVAAGLSLAALSGSFVLGLAALLLVPRPRSRHVSAKPARKAAMSHPQTRQVSDRKPPQ